MASDRSVAPTLRPDELDAAWFAGCDWLHLAGYSLLESPIAEAAEAAAGLRTGRLSIDLSSWTAIRGSGLRERLERLRPDVVFGNEQEWQALGDGVAAPVRVVKRGARGFSVGDEDVPPAEGEVVDSTGAGDALVAGFLVGGPELARDAA